MTTFFGNDVLNGNVSISSGQYAEAFVANLDGSITSGRIYVAPEIGGGDGLTSLAIYSDDSGAPDEFLGISNAITVPDGGSEGWQDVTFSTPIPVLSGTTYWLSVQADVEYNIGRNDATSDTMYFTFDYSTPANPFTASGIHTSTPGTLGVQAGIDVPALPLYLAIRNGLAANLNHLNDDPTLWGKMKGITVSPYMLANPPIPTVQVMPGEIHYDIVNARGGDEVMFTIQAFVVDNFDVSAQANLDLMLSDAGPLSIKALVEADCSLGGVVDDLRVTLNTGYNVYSVQGRGPVLGADWTVEIITSSV